MTNIQYFSMHKIRYRVIVNLYCLLKWQTNQYQPCGKKVIYFGQKCTTQGPIASNGWKGLSFTDAMRMATFADEHTWWSIATPPFRSIMLSQKIWSGFLIRSNGLQVYLFNIICVKMHWTLMRYVLVDLSTYVFGDFLWNDNTCISCSTRTTPYATTRVRSWLSCWLNCPTMTKLIILTCFNRGTPWTAWSTWTLQQCIDGCEVCQDGNVWSSRTFAFLAQTATVFGRGVYHTWTW